MKTTTQILEREAKQIAGYAVRALLYEAATTPKPGLVDRRNSGSHRDMDFYSFLNSSAALWPYFEECARIGQQTADDAAPLAFRTLREAGKLAESCMLCATGGVNTHKGSVFLMGIVAAAAGRLSAQESEEPENAIQRNDTLPMRKDPEKILAECAKMTAGLVKNDFSSVTEENAKTMGELLYARYGITGIRGQAEAGLPAVSVYGLPLLKKLLNEGKSNDEAGAAVLMNIISHTEDTNLICRSNIGRQRKAASEAQQLMEESGLLKEEKTDAQQDAQFMQKLEETDRAYIRENLSPGGSADLLAVCWFLYTIETEDL